MLAGRYTYLNGNRLHVVEAQGRSWAQCMNGTRCGFGSLVEVFELDETSGTLDVLGEYDSTWAGAPFAQGLGAFMLSPTDTGLMIYRADALP